MAPAAQFSAQREPRPRRPQNNNGSSITATISEEGNRVSFVVTLGKTAGADPDGRLGMELHFSRVLCWYGLVVKDVFAVGTVGAWNRAQLACNGHQVLPGDCIVRVNQVAGNAELMLRELKSEGQALQIEISRDLLISRFKGAARLSENTGALGSPALDEAQEGRPPLGEGQDLPLPPLKHTGPPGEMRAWQAEAEEGYEEPGARNLHWQKEDEGSLVNGLRKEMLKLSDDSLARLVVEVIQLRPDLARRLFTQPPKVQPEQPRATTGCGGGPQRPGGGRNNSQESASFPDLGLTAEALFQLLQNSPDGEGGVPFPLLAHTVGVAPTEQGSWRAYLMADPMQRFQLCAGQFGLLVTLAEQQSPPMVRGGPRSETLAVPQRSPPLAMPPQQFPVQYAQQQGAPPLGLDQGGLSAPHSGYQMSLAAVAGPGQEPFGYSLHHVGLEDVQAWGPQAGGFPDQQEQPTGFPAPGLGHSRGATVFGAPLIRYGGKSNAKSKDSYPSL